MTAGRNAQRAHAREGSPLAQAAPRPIVVIGLGQGTTPLGPAAAAELDRAELLYGAPRLLAAFAGHPAARLPMTRDLDADAAELSALAGQGRRVVVLADGDGLFFGIGASLAARLPAGALTAHPHVDAVSLAASRFGLPRNTLRTVSAHGRQDLGELWQALSQAELTAVFTDPEHTPARLAAALRQRLGPDGEDRFEVFLAQRLGQPDERTSRLSLAQAAHVEAASPNLVIFRRKRPFEPIVLGRHAADYGAPAQPVTKPLVRSAILSALRLTPGLTLWDLGAGSGSVSIEAWPLLAPGRILAVEADPARAERLRANVARFGALGVDVLAGDMDALLPDLPTPERIFIGGGLSGPTARDIVDRALERLAPGGILVAATVLLESLFALIDRRHALSDFTAEILQIGVSRSTPLGAGLRLTPENPVFLVCLQKGSL